MCEQCMAETIDIGEIVPGWFLCRATQDGWMMKAGDYGLIQCNDPDFIIPAKFKPIPDSTFNMSDEEINNLPTDGIFTDGFFDLFEDILPYLRGSLSTCGSLYEACKEDGYNVKEHGICIEMWLIHKMGEAIVEFEGKYPNGLPEGWDERYKDV